MKFSLPIDSAARKGIAVYTGCIGYFAAALAGVAAHSKAGNDKHNKGLPLHHARGKSGDHADCVVRHIMDIGDILAFIEREREFIKTEFGNEGLPPSPETVKALLDEANALSWRSLALSQELHERFGGAPLAPSARAPEAAPKPAAEPDAVEQYRAAELAAKGPPAYPGRPAAKQQFCRMAACMSVIDRPREYCDEHTPAATPVATPVPEETERRCANPGCYNNRAPRGGRYCVAHIPSSM